MILIKFEGSRAGIPREQALLRKSNPQKITRKVDFLSLPFTMHLICTLLMGVVQKILGKS